jgi:hypothetical protein
MLRSSDDTDAALGPAGLVRPHDVAARGLDDPSGGADIPVRDAPRMAVYLKIETI